MTAGCPSIRGVKPVTRNVPLPLAGRVNLLGAFTNILSVFTYTIGFMRAYEVINHNTQHTAESPAYIPSLPLSVLCFLLRRMETIGGRRPALHPLSLQALALNRFPVSLKDP